MTAIDSTTVAETSHQQQTNICDKIKLTVSNFPRKRFLTKGSRVRGLGRLATAVHWRGWLYSETVPSSGPCLCVSTLVLLI